MDDQQATTGDSKLISHNSAAWDKWVEEGDRWTTPVSAAEIAAAREGEWAIYLTEEKPTPRDWFPACLLYTSDAADERSSVDLGGRRIIKKKKNDKYIRKSAIT